MTRQKKEPEELYVVRVWNITEGDIIKVHRDVTYAQAQEIREQYADEPFYEIQVDDR